MGNKNIGFDYDSNADVLYASIGNPKDSYALEVSDGIDLLLDPVTNDLTGFVIIDYMARIERGLLKQVPRFEDIQLPTYS